MCGCSKFPSLSLSSYAVSRTPEDSKICLAALSPSPENPDPHNYGVFLKPGQRMIGVVGAFRSKCAEAGYIFNEAFWGRGYASEALQTRLCQRGCIRTMQPASGCCGSVGSGMWRWWWWWVGRKMVCCCCGWRNRLRPLICDVLWGWSICHHGHSLALLTSIHTPKK